ncbi:putative PAS/PAC sensor protein [Dinoroseobacter shibae DFL 12 = DSM 16493]|jgi:PAS domain-containing protein|uniref:Putative PAS/PAC sensor protein n=2 Tax=Dinoroseobacter shibae TaxID=215813 RepID=A8LPA1_DINSH|nr:PAS-domain containing protein [Dinoroseobacter shibae]ABV95166.1 putative PAS/PAC sensor protein [Dinoroseobacter shibae DFL 12 = DSM 16493]URF46579.1 PAS-domain containing protein [Dinoroseobacter shibae]URF50885.1 PAS-domain containing protein [Dinoroseobacter shibae]
MAGMDFTLLATLLAVAFLTAALALYALNTLSNRDFAQGPGPTLPVRTDLDGPSADQITAQRRELAQLRATVEHIPLILWRQDNDGALTWANKPYIDLTEKLHPDRAGRWPMPHLFKQKSLAHPDTPGHRRISIDMEDGEKRWFEVQGFRVQDEILYSATPIDMTVKAEVSLRNFVQTLTSTFAHLQVGLAIFDKRRQLVLFNPALTDLTTLEPEWLSARPGLSEVLDRLRDKNMLPEPKDYKEWRNRLTGLEKAASSGTFEETWALPTGQNYRILGRPHHDGGIALTFEDISSEVSLTRRFRSEIELGQTALDTLEEAIAVFSENGTLVLSNKAYSELWDVSENDGLMPVSIVDATRHWQQSCQPNPIWGDIRDFATTSQGRADWEDYARLQDGGTILRCRVAPLAQGMTLVGFKTLEAVPEFQPAKTEIAQTA